jgi:hypothetical protein
MYGEYICALLLSELELQLEVHLNKQIVSLTYSQRVNFGVK